MQEQCLQSKFILGPTMEKKKARARSGAPECRGGYVWGACSLPSVFTSVLVLLASFEGKDILTPFFIAEGGEAIAPRSLGRRLCARVNQSAFAHCQCQS